MRLRTLAFALGLAGLGFAVYTQRDAIAAFDWSVDRGALVAAVLLMAVAPLVQAVTFVVALRSLGVEAPWDATLRMWARSFLLRYEPSGAVGFAYRVVARERVGASTAQVLTATGYEQLGAVAAGAVAAVAGFLAAGVDPPLLAIALCAGAVGAVVAVRPAFLGGWVVARLRARGIQTAGLLPTQTLAAFVTLNLIGWGATGAGAYTLVRALGAGGELDAYLLLGAFALSWLLGVLVPLAPGGLGLRDASLIVSLTAAVGSGVATALAVALRLVSFAAELLAVAVLELLVLALPRRAAAPAAPPLAAADRTGTIVVVPTYDEAEALPLFVERFAATGLELLIVDDASPDGTGALADELAATRPWMHVLHRAEKDGLGRAYRAGFGWCLQRGYRAIGQMDCDLSHPPEKVAEMLAVLDARDADLVIGNRYLPGGGTAGWSRARRVLSRAGCTGSRLVLGLPFSDLSGGFKLWRASCLAEMDFDAMLADGYAFQVEATQLAYLMGKRIEEVPFVFSERIAGTSKMTLAISIEGIRVTLKLRRRARRPRALAL
ncbi:MAG TPA: glycosyltransferase [Solirubrobacteraceae bacterium]